MEILSFKQWLEYNGEFLLEEDNFGKSHSTHLEDLVVLKGKKGIAQALAGFLYIKRTFGTSNIHSSAPVTVKFDGAPAIISGWLGDRFFVATKSLFNKDPKINFSNEDIDKNHPSGPNKQLHLAYKNLKTMIPKGKIYQGDFLFTSDSKKEVTHENIQYITFQPNTIVYSVRKDSPLGKEISKKEMGIVFHTEYQSDGVSVESIKLKGFGVSENNFKKNSNVFLIDAYHKDYGSIIAFTTQENYVISKQLNMLKSMAIPVISPALSKEIMTFCNSFIRAGATIPDASQLPSMLIDYLTSKQNNAISKLKSDKGKTKKKAEWDVIISEANKQLSKIENIFIARDIITKLKMKLINKLDSVSQLKTFVKKSDGSLVVTGNEGFVLTSTSARGCKLVDRLEFSKNNFSSEVAKGWESSTRH